MNAQIAFVAIAAATTIATIFVITLPRQILQPKVRSRLWRLLDDIDDAIMTGVLPADHAGVALLRRRAWVMAKGADRLRLADVLLIEAMHEDDDVPAINLGGLTSSQAELAAGFRNRLHVLAPLVVATSTWIGVVFGALAIVHAYRWSRGARTKVTDNPTTRASFVVAEQRVDGRPRDLIAA